MTTNEPRRPTTDVGAASVFSVLAVTSHRPAEFLDPLAATGLDVAVLKLDAGVGPPARVVSAVRRTRRAVRRHDPDFLLLDCYETLGAPAAWVAARNDVPVIARLVGDPWRKLREERLDPARERRDLPRYLRHRVSHQLNEFIFECASGFVTVSTELARVVDRRTDCPPERVGVVPVPVTTDTAATG